MLFQVYNILLQSSKAQLIQQKLSIKFSYYLQWI